VGEDLEEKKWLHQTLGKKKVRLRKNQRVQKNLTRGERPMGRIVIGHKNKKFFKRNFPRGKRTGQEEKKNRGRRGFVKGVTRTKKYDSLGDRGQKRPRNGKKKSKDSPGGVH